MAAPGSGNDQAGENKFVRLLQKAIAGLSPGDEAGRRDLYDRGRSLLINGLNERKDLTLAEAKVEIHTFDDAVCQVEANARALAVSFGRREPQSNAATMVLPDSRAVEARREARERTRRRRPSPEGRPDMLRKIGGRLVRSAVGARVQLSEAAVSAKQRMVTSLSRVELRSDWLASWFAGRDRAGSKSSGQSGSDSAAQLRNFRPDIANGDVVDIANPQRQIRLQAVIRVARHHGVELDVNEFRGDASQSLPSAAAMSEWAQNAGLWSRAVRIGWRNLMRMSDAEPVILLFKDGSAGLMVGVSAEQHVIMMQDLNAPLEAQPVAVDELRLAQVWDGEAILVRANRGRIAADAPFSLRWLASLVLQEHRSLRDIGIASVTISLLTIFPPLLVMTMVNKVLQFHSISTLILLAVVMAVVVVYEAVLGHARRLIIAVVGARLDARLNLHVFNRLLRLPLDYFERHPAGETMFRIAQVYKVRQFLTGRLLTTFLDLITLCVLLPFLFYLSPILASIVLGCAIAILLVILAYLKPMREMYNRVTTAETWKSATLGETIVGIKTVKALALEPQRRSLWDERIAEAGKWQLAFSKLSNWPQTLVTPIERIMVIGTVMLGAYIAMNDPSGYMVGGLFAFFMLSGRAAQPLVGLARLIEEYEEIGAAIGEAASVLNRPAESNARSAGLRPKFAGEISFQDVTFTYSNTTVPALDRVSFSVPAGTTLGIVGRSGSGKSTITRLLQGINRDYKGFVKIDGVDLRDVDLRHLRQSLGVVLQENFLFRGSIRDNVIAGRPGLTLSDAVYAARLAGAEEFIERMPNGFETYIEEGSPNLSGGQRQRLAIARALIIDPRILILDEATSALDPESEAVVTGNLERIANGRTMIIVSHRLSSLVDCDQILVLEQGGIVDCGKHEVLVERCAIYRQLWNQQNRHGVAPRPSAAPRLVTGAPEA
ncbi:peptidase domain-containing ABC transporter [Bradyrhizobium mercantei]|uniref:peptidase domain-containing ABC transporter n=1 Tax=Bradyrhizobium mercantei TaxID=1904807 RepID=UPI001FD9FFA4|nr:peptidase domain-containing ABC transporter [Bradyrhizobium mercantei]